MGSQSCGSGCPGFGSVAWWTPVATDKPSGPAQGRKTHMAGVGRRTDESPAISQMEVSVGISHPIDSVLLSYPPACLYFQLLGAN